MKALRVVLVCLCAVLMAAHGARAGSLVLAGLVLTTPALLAVRKRWAPTLLALALTLAALEWIRTLLLIAHRRIDLGAPWLRMALILAGVAGVNLLAAWIVWCRRPRPA